MPKIPAFADSRPCPPRRAVRPRRPALVLIVALAPIAAAAQSVCRPDAPAWATQGLRLPVVNTGTAGPEDDRVHLEADHLSGATGESLIADGRAQLRRGLLTLQADHMEYRQRDDRVKASGQVLLARGDDRYQGSELSLNTEHQEGYFLEPRFYLGRNQAGGRAERVDFIGKNRMVVRGAAYSSCELVEGETPPWVLTTRRVRLDFDANEGLAEGAVLRFYGVPILAAPVLSFPVTDARKSGWLPPLITTSSNTGVGLSMPYYWNIAPDLDATFTPTLLTKRGAGLESEFRYLREHWRGEVNGFWLPRDLTTGQPRWAARWTQRGELPSEVRYDWHGLRVSDDDYWKDGLRGADSLTPRLLPSMAQVQQRRLLQVSGLGVVDQHLYARLQHWQVLQNTDPGALSALIEAPYQRTPQIGALWSGRGGPLQWSLETEFNHFTHTDTDADTTRLGGSRLHALGQVALPLGDEGWRLTPRASFNAAGYQVDQPLSDGRTRAGRLIPSFSLDSAWSLDRETQGFGRELTQTLEPRLLYAYTPWRDQSMLPNFDSAALDFNATTVFSENVFSGVDRVSDAHQVTGGLTTRYLDRRSGAELARLGIAQRFQLSDQRLTADGVPATSRFSDVLVQGSVTAIPRWTLDSSLQFNTDTDRVVRTITSVRYSPGPLRTLYASHRLKRGASEQFALGWQWPLDGLLAPLATDGTTARAASRAASSCEGRVYGVGALDYSLKDRRISGAIVGFEYDAGCWIGRVVARRQSTSSQASSTQLMLQLELVGLSRLGTNPLSVLKDNIPGYQLLRDPQAAAVNPPAPGGDTDTP